MVHNLENKCSKNKNPSDILKDWIENHSKVILIVKKEQGWQHPYKPR